MLSRRKLLALTSGLWLSGMRAAAAADRLIKIGILPFGTASWEIETIRRNGLDEARGVRIEPVKLANNEAARIAFQSGAIDIIVSDLFLAARMRAEGQRIKFLPFSSTEGAVMLPPASPIRTVADLRGRKIGVSGGPLDKSWLLLQAYARREAGFDIAADATLAFAAPPLLAEKLQAAELDAALLYWSFCARLEAKGFKRLISASDMAREFGVKGPVALLGYLVREERERADIAAFAAASRDAKRRLAVSDADWEALKPLMQAGDEATFRTFKSYFIAGIPSRPPLEERADAERLYEIVAKLGGEKLVGRATTLPKDLHWDSDGVD